jgi:hypothetical protein
MPDQKLVLRKQQRARFKDATAQYFLTSAITTVLYNLYSVQRSYKKINNFSAVCCFLWLLFKSEEDGAGSAIILFSPIESP